MKIRVYKSELLELVEDNRRLAEENIRLKEELRHHRQHQGQGPSRQFENFEGLPPSANPVYQDFLQSELNEEHLSSVEITEVGETIQTMIREAMTKE